MIETQGIDEKDNVNQNKEQTRIIELESPKAGTATSSPDYSTASPTIISVMLWMKKQAYEDTTIKATAKRLKHLQKNCLLADSESVKLFVPKKKCGNGFSTRRHQNTMKAFM